MLFIEGAICIFKSYILAITCGKVYCNILVGPCKWLTSTSN